MKGGDELTVGNDRFDKFINGKSKETVNDLRKFWNKKFMETVHHGGPQMTTDGEKVMDKLNDETQRINKEIKNSFESILQNLDTSCRINIAWDAIGGATEGEGYSQVEGQKEIKTSLQKILVVLKEHSIDKGEVVVEGPTLDADFNAYIAGKKDFTREQLLDIWAEKYTEKPAPSGAPASANDEGMKIIEQLMEAEKKYEGNKRFREVFNVVFSYSINDTPYEDL